MDVQIRLMGERDEAQAVWDDVELALKEKGYAVEFGGMKQNHGDDDGYRLYGEVE